MNIKHTIGATIVIVAAALGTAALTQSPTETVVPGPATLLAPASADPYPRGRTSPTESGGVPDPVRLMTAETAEFDNQAYTADDTPQIIGLDPGIYVVPAWGADTHTTIRSV